MKKILALAASSVLAATAVAGFAACQKDDGNNSESSSVTLQAIAATEVGTNSDVDYYVVPEPAASAKVKAITANGGKLYNVGSLQTLYGENGYPQAVIVAKSTLIESDGAFVKEFIDAYKNTATWLAAQTDYAAIVNSISACGTTTLTAAQLNATVVANCNINYVSATDDKANVINYMNSVKEIEPNMYGECKDAFFQSYSALTTTSSSLTSVSVYMPDGAPAVSMAYMLSGSVTLSKTVSYNVVDADTISSKVNNDDASKNADICVLPVNAAAKLLGSGEKYKLLGTVTHGNLFILSSDETAITSSNVAEKLNGKTVGVIQLAKVPGLTFKMVLKKYGVEYTQANQ